MCLCVVTDVINSNLHINMNNLHNNQCKRTYVEVTCSAGKSCLAMQQGTRGLQLLSNYIKSKNELNVLSRATYST